MCSSSRYHVITVRRVKKKTFLHSIQGLASLNVAKFVLVLYTGVSSFP